MYRNSVNFMKITTEFTNTGCEFCLVSRPNNNNSRLTVRFKVSFLGGCTQKTRRVVWVRNQVSEAWSCVICRQMCRL